MTFVINGPRFTNGGTIVGNVTLGDGRTVFDNTHGVVTGKIRAGGGNDVFIVGERGETVFGEDGNDKLVGGLGNDRLNGGAGKDVLSGGAGNDIFIFDAAPLPASFDVVQDFDTAADSLQFRKAVFTSVARKGSLAADALHFGTKAADAEDRFIYNKATGNLAYDPDGTGAMAQVKIAVFANKAQLTLSDFIIV